MKETKLSIIIPFYNTPSEYILRCLKSISDQEYDQYEIIIVDDGSVEGNRLFLREISQKNEKIRFIEKEHSGVSNTRNIGINNAVGEYIAFVDADDTVSDSFLLESIGIAEKYDFPDIVIGGIEYIPYSHCNETQFGDLEDYYDEKQIELLKKSLLHIRDKRVKYNILGSPCAKLFKKSMLSDNIRFPEDVPLCEDQIFNRLVLMKAKTAVVVPHMWYQYFQNDFSVMHTKVKDNFWEMKRRHWDEVYKLDSIETDEIKDGLRGVYIRSFVNLAATYCRNRIINNDIKRKIILEALDHPLIQLATNNLTLRSKIPLSWKIQWLVVKAKKYIIINIIAHVIN